MDHDYMGSHLQSDPSNSNLAQQTNQVGRWLANRSSHHKLYINPTFTTCGLTTKDLTISWPDYDCPRARQNEKNGKSNFSVIRNFYLYIEGLDWQQSGVNKIVNDEYEH